MVWFWLRGHPACTINFSDNPSVGAANLGIEQASEFLSRNLPANLRMLLTPLALHDVYLDLDYLEEMSRRVRAPIDRAEINLFAKTLETAQLLLDCGQSIYQISPTLATALHVEPLPDTDAWARVFVE